MLSLAQRSRNTWPFLARIAAGMQVAGHPDCNRRARKEPKMSMMRAAVFEKQGSIKLREVPKPRAGVGEALIRVTLTTICGTDVHILRGEYPVRAGLIVGHEPVG